MTLCYSSTASAWTISEHARLTEDAVTRLSREAAPNDYAELRDDWQAIITDMANDLPFCEAPARAACDTSPPDTVGLPSGPTRHGVARCVTFADLPALAADHSCSPRDLHRILAAARRAEDPARPQDISVHWIFKVLRDAQVSHGILQDNPGTSAADVRRRDNDRDDINLDLAIHDPAYVTRAGANTAHFVLPRSSGTESFKAWVLRASATSQGLNNTSAYAWYHARALRLASLVAPYGKAPRAGRLLWWVYLHEVFALHFLEDAFAAGHFVSVSPNKTIRNGTHDYFCSHGYRDTRIWGDLTRGYHAFGDAFLTGQDEVHAAAAVATSLKQVVAVLHGQAQASDPIKEMSITAFDGVSSSVDSAEHAFLRLDELDVCTQVTNHDPSLALAAASNEITSVLAQTPQPTIANDETLSTYRNNTGLILGVGADVTGSAAFTFEGDGGRSSAQLMVHAGIGFSADGVVSSYRDGTAFMLSGLAAVETGTSGVSFGAGGRLRLPWSVVPVFEPLVALGPIVAETTWGFRRGAAMSGRLNASFPRSSNNLLMLNVLREVDVMRYGPSKPIGADPHASRTEIRVPIVSWMLRGDRETQSRTSTSVGVDLGARYAYFGHDTVSKHELGFYISLHPEVVLFPSD